MLSTCKILSMLTCCLIWMAAELRCCGQEFFPGNISELRPPHVRVSEGAESAANPRGGRSFDFFTAPPAIPPQSEVRLTEVDLLSLVYPAESGSFHSGGSALRDRLRIEDRQIELELFHFFNPFGPIGNALIPPSERSLFIGKLPAGDYQVNIRNWNFPWDTLLGFDPETFVPPANAIKADSQIIALPQGNEAPIYSESSFHFLVIAVPESTSLALATVAFFSSLACVRYRIARI